MGDFVYVEFLEVGKEVSKGDVFCEIESVKVVSEVYVLVSGEVIEVNEVFEDSFEFFNEDFYENWIVKFKLINFEEEFKEFMDV